MVVSSCGREVPMIWCAIAQLLQALLGFGVEGLTKREGCLGVASRIWVPLLVITPKEYSAMPSWFIPKTASVFLLTLQKRHKNQMIFPQLMLGVLIPSKVYPQLRDIWLSGEAM